MTTHERVMEAIHNYNFNEGSNGINELIAYAYYLGRCEKAKELCDKAHYVFTEQHERASQCRYHQLAEKVIGHGDIIYDGDYDQWILMFKTDKVKI